MNARVLYDLKNEVYLWPWSTSRHLRLEHDFHVANYLHHLELSKENNNGNIRRTVSCDCMLSIDNSIYIISIERTMHQMPHGHSPHRTQSSIIHLLLIQTSPHEQSRTRTILRVLIIIQSRHHPAPIRRWPPVRINGGGLAQVQRHLVVGTEL